MLRNLLKREIGQDRSIFLQRKLAWTVGQNLELSPNSVERVFKTNASCIDFESSENRYLLGGYGKGGIVVYDTFIPSETNIYPSVATVDRSHKSGHKFSVDCIQWYPHDTGMFVSLSADQTVKIWDTNELEVVENFKFNANINFLHLSEKAKSHALVAVACKDSNLYLCDMKSGSKTHSLVGHDGSILTTKWSPRREHLLVTASVDKHIYVWDVRKGKSILMSLESDVCGNHVAHDGFVNALEFTSDGLSLLSFGSDNQLRLWDIANGTESNVRYSSIDNPAKRPVQIAVSRNFPQELVFVPIGYNIDVFEIFSGKYLKTLAGHFSAINGCCYNSPNMELFSCSLDTQILSWMPINQVLEMDKEAFKDSWSDED